MDDILEDCRIISKERKSLILPIITCLCPNVELDTHEVLVHRPTLGVENCQMPSAMGLQTRVVKTTTGLKELHWSHPELSSQLPDK